jgi:hypothetical protein
MTEIKKKKVDKTRSKLTRVNMQNLKLGRDIRVTASKSKLNKIMKFNHRITKS